MINTEYINKVASTNRSRCKIIAAIPCLNTEASIDKVISEVKEYVDQVIVVDDGSYDRTAEIARNGGALVKSHGVNRGKGAAMQTAVEAAEEADIIVFLDGDGQHNPGDLPAIVAPLLDSSADLVIGSRFIRGSKVNNAPLIRKLSNNLAAWVVSIIISFLIQPKLMFRYPLKGHKITDCTSGFRAIKKESWKKLDLISDGFELDVEIIFEAAKNNLVIIERPISCVWNNGTSHLSIVRDGFKTLVLLARKITGCIAR